LADGKVFIVAEAGVNHDGSLEKALALVDIAAHAEADAVKFQTFKPGECTGRFAHKVGYLRCGALEDGESRFEMSSRLALSYDDFRKIKEYCDKKGILFFSTPDGVDSLDFLVDELGIPIIKIASTEVTHLRFLEAIARKNRPIIFSTGMSDLGEVKKGLEVIRKHTEKKVVLLHCTSEYPAPDEEINVKAMVSMAEKFKVPVGFSDHSLGNEAAIAAVALGAEVVEKHFTLDKGLPGPDHKASLDSDELAAWVKAVRKTEVLMGDGVKRPTPSELDNMKGIRRGVVAARALEVGTVLTEAMLTAKRPWVEIEPAQVGRLVGMVLKRDLCKDEPVRWGDIR
jgi:N-acetylneuraminate synthase/N,N'-diacetyllegionaminate synthase